MKKIFALSLAIVMLFALVSCNDSNKGGSAESNTGNSQDQSNDPASEATSGAGAESSAPAESNSESGESSAPAEEKTDANTDKGSADALLTGWHAGVCIYKFDDTFMTSVRDAMSARAAELGATLDIVDSQNKQPEQNNQVDNFLISDVQALCVNPVDRVAAAPLMEKAKESQLPIVFINRQPEDDVMQKYDKVWYVGAKAEQSGTLSGEIIVDYFKAHPEADKNGDGKVQFVMLQGEPGHQDATLRTEYSQKAFKDAGLEYEALAMDTAYWDTAKATDLMNVWITSYGLDKIEAILANNDDMALGAIAALNSKGYNQGDPEKYIPVVGVDATVKALAAMEDGSLLGTVLNDGKNQGKAAVNIMAAALAGKEINEENIGFPVTDGKWVWIEYVKVTKDNYQDFK